MTASCKVRAAVAPAAALLLTLAGPACGDSWQDPDSIRSAAEQAALAPFANGPARVIAAAAPLDPRLRVHGCEQALTSTLPTPSQESGRVTAEVRCDGARPWRLFVPVRVSVYRTLAVAAVPLERGKVLAAGDVILAEREVGATPGGYLTTVDAALGRALRRNVAAGAMLAPTLLESPLMVRRGQSVTLEARAGAITVQMAGVARSDGALGQTIPVANTSSRKIMQGIVRSEKIVEIRLR